MPAPLAFIPAAIKIGVGIAKGATAVKTAGAVNLGINALPLTAAPIVPIGKAAVAGAAKVSVVTGAVPLGLKSAAPTVGVAGLATGAKKIATALGLAGAIGIQVDQALKGDQKISIPTKSGEQRRTSDPRSSNATTYAQPQPQSQPQTRSQVLTPPQPAPFATPTTNPRSPIVGLDITPGGALGFPVRGATGKINLGAIDSSRKGLKSPTSLDQVESGGVNLLTPIVAKLKELETTVNDLQEIPKTTLTGIIELLNPIVKMTATTLEGVAKMPQLNADSMLQSLAPVLLGIFILESLFDDLTKNIKNIDIAMKVEIPQGLAMQMEVPQGLAMQMEVPQGLAMQMEVPQGLAMQMEVPQGLAMQMEVPQGLAMQMEVPQGLAMQMEVPQGLAMQMEVPQGLAMQMEVPQGLAMQITVPQDLVIADARPDVNAEVQQLRKMMEQTKKSLEACCKDISNKMKKKKKEDDDRFPEFKNSGLIECDGGTIPYDYAGEGLKGLNKQLDVILGMNKMLIKKVCDIDATAFTFPDIFGSGTYVCDETFGTYNYSGVGLLGLQNQIDRVLEFNQKILNQVCDIEIEFPLIQGGGTYVCDETFGTYNYSGIGLLGLQNQIDRVLDFNKKILDEVCDIDVPAFSFPDIFGGGTYTCGSDVFDSSYSGSGLLGLSSQIDKLTAISAKILGEVCETDTKISGDINFLDCEGGTQILLYSGEGIIGLSTQVTALTELAKLTYAEACKTVSCVPVQPGDEFAEFDVPRQLVLTWGEEYPTQKGSLWHTQIPNPREDLEWCRDFDNLIYTKGNVYGRLLWGNSKIKSGVRAESEDEAERILDLIDALSVSEGKLRITKGGAVKLNPAVRPVRCVRAAIAELGSNGIAVAVKCFVPPIEDCP